MLDIVNERLIAQGRGADRVRPRLPRGHLRHVRHRRQRQPARPAPRDDDLPAPHARASRTATTITLEPWRATAFPVVKDLVVDRSAFDRIIAAGGFISVATGSAPDGNAIPVPKSCADRAMDAAACIGCGACVAACPNASAMLFVAAKVSHLALLPQGQPERYDRVLAMVAQMDAEGFGTCTNHGECARACPKEIRQEFIAQLNRDFFKASLMSRPKAAEARVRLDESRLRGCKRWRSAVVASLLAAASPCRRPTRSRPAAPPLRVTLLGTGNPRPSPERYGPSILVEAGRRRHAHPRRRGARRDGAPLLARRARAPLGYRPRSPDAPPLRPRRRACRTCG